MADVALAEIFPPEAVVTRLAGPDRPAAIRELVDRLVRVGRLPQSEADSVVQGILAHEALGPSAVGGGIAAPSCRTSATEEFVGAIGLAPGGIGFEGSEPVIAVFVLVAPLDRREWLFEILGRVAALGADKTQRLRLMGCRTPDEVHSLLRELDRR